MTVTIELPPEIEADLVARAHSQGLALSSFVEMLLKEQAPTGFKVSVAPDERMKIWRESAKHLPQTPLLSDDAISRESINGDRG